MHTYRIRSRNYINLFKTDLIKRELITRGCVEQRGLCSGQFINCFSLVFVKVFYARGDFFEIENTIELTIRLP